MNCQICKNKFYLKRGILDLFNTDIDYICRKCRSKYKINLSFDTIILDKYEVKICSMFEKKFLIDFNAFCFEYSKIYHALNKMKDYKLLFFDSIKFNNSTYEFLDLLTKLNESNLIILVLYVDNDF